jgi:hypothetical protein
MSCVDGWMDKLHGWMDEWIRSMGGWMDKFHGWMDG